MQGPEPGARWRVAALVCSHPHLQALRGLPSPAHWQGAQADAPFSVFCRLGSASSCGRRVGVAAKWERDLPQSLPCSSPTPRTTGIQVQVQRAPSPCCIPDSPSGPTTQPKPPLQLLSSARALRRHLLLLPHLRSQKRVIGEGQEAPAQTPCGCPQPCFRSSNPP